MTSNLIRIGTIGEFSPLKVGRLETKLRTGQDLTALEKLMVYQALSRYWRRYLTPLEVVVLTYIVDRSVGWGKGNFVACADNVLFGDTHYSGVGISRSSYYRVLKGLEEKGAISRKSLRDRTPIQLHVGWVREAEPD